ncbi:MAG: TonB-dependent receptor, partial [Cyclobacteriaceae bacterium]|nr:TonB-dependent receptor [Cyclobacteriaceae bacterium]
MIRIIFVLSFFAFNLQSKGQSIENLVIKGNYQDQPLSLIFSDLQERYPVAFYYKDKWLPDKKFSIRISDETIDSAIPRLLAGTGLNYVIYLESIIVAPQNLLGQEFTQSYFMTKSKQQNLAQSQKWATASDIIMLGDTGKVDSKKEAVITGKITDQLTGEPLIGVNMFFEALESSATTDREGNFKIAIPTGLNLLQITYIGYETRKVLLRVFGDAQLLLELAPEAYELDEILITGETANDNVETVIMGITRLRPREIQELPVFLGEADVIKSLLTLPGVSTVGEGAGGFNVRGGSIDQNLILQDEALIFNSAHALGFFSIFNPDALREVTLYKGHIPAQYGGRLASVLDVKMKGHGAEKMTGSGGIGAVSSRLVLEGPVRFKNVETENSPKTTFLLGGRITYSDWVLQLINDPDIQNSSAFFYDFNVKFSHPYSDKGSVTAAYYQGYDKVQFSQDYGFSWKNGALSIIWNHLINQDLSSNFSVSYGNSENLSFQPSGIDAFNLTNGLENVRISQNFLYSGFSRHNLQAGGEYIRYYMKPDQLEPRLSGSGVISQQVDKDDGREMGLYLNDEYTINHLFSVSAGLRFNIFQQTGPGDVFLYQSGLPRSPDSIIDTIGYSQGEIVESFNTLEPRLSLKYSIDPVSSIKLSYNRMNQFIHLISNTTAAVPVDFWQVSGPYYSPQRSDNYSLGYYRNILDNIWETSLEIYYRDIHNQMEYKDLPELLLNDHLETELLAGIGKAYGAELYVRKKRGRLNGWLSYTYSRVFSRVDGPKPEDRINQGEWFPSTLDKPHNLNLVFNYNINKSNSFSANFTYNSGRPIAVPAANYYV